MRLAHLGESEGRKYAGLRSAIDPEDREVAGRLITLRCTACNQSAYLLGHSQRAGILTLYFCRPCTFRNLVQEVDVCPMASSSVTMTRLKISHKLNLAFALIISIFLLTAGATAWRIEKVSEATLRMEESSERLKIGSAWQGDVRQNSARSLAVAYAEGNAVLDFFKDAMASTSQATN